VWKERERNEREGSKRLGFFMGGRECGVMWCGVGGFDQVGKKDKWLVVTDRAGFGR
jgi:hypothetical protein